MYFKNILSIIKRNKLYLFLCIAVFILGIILSFFMDSEEIEIIFYDKISCLYSLVLKKEMLLSSLIIKKLLLTILLLLIILISGIKIWFIPIHFICFLYQGFILGTIIWHLSKIFSFVGILISCCAIIPASVILFGASSLLSLLLFNYNNCNCKNINYSALIQYFLLAFTIGIIACIIEIILLFVIINPLNLLI